MVMMVCRYHRYPCHVPSSARIHPERKPPIYVAPMKKIPVHFHRSHLVVAVYLLYSLFPHSNRTHQPAGMISEADTDYAGWLGLKLSTYLGEVCWRRKCQHKIYCLPPPQLPCPSPADVWSQTCICSLVPMLAWTSLHNPVLFKKNPEANHYCGTCTMQQPVETISRASITLHSLDPILIALETTKDTRKWTMEEDQYVRTLLMPYPAHG